MGQELTNLMLQLSASTVKKRQNLIRAKENKQKDQKLIDRFNPVHKVKG